MADASHVQDSGIQGHWGLWGLWGFQGSKVPRFQGPKVPKFPGVIITADTPHVKHFDHLPLDMAWRPGKLACRAGCTRVLGWIVRAQVAPVDTILTSSPQVPPTPQ